MSRRFLTVEDLNRAEGVEVVVDEDTVVTPQALEAAAARGIAIRTVGGAYSEPSPDRGPDAARAARSLPHLPEPPDSAGEKDHAIGIVVTVVGRNRPGVLAEVTGALAKLGANIHNISQKMVEEYFHMVLTVELPPGGSFSEFGTALECLGSPDDYAVSVMHERVFRFMHRI